MKMQVRRDFVHFCILLEQKVGEKTYMASRQLTFMELRSSKLPWRINLYLTIRNLRRYIRKSIELDEKEGKT